MAGMNREQIDALSEQVRGSGVGPSKMGSQISGVGDALASGGASNFDLTGNSATPESLLKPAYEFYNPAADKTSGMYVSGAGMNPSAPKAPQVGGTPALPLVSPPSVSTTPAPIDVKALTAAAEQGIGNTGRLEAWRDQQRTEQVMAGMEKKGEQPFYSKTTDAQGNVTLTARGTPPAPAGMGGTKDIEAQIQDLVNKVSSTSSFDELFATKLKAGMLTNVLKEKGELEKANIMGKYGLESAKLRRGELDEIARGNLDARIAHNKVLEQDLQLRLAQQKDVAQQKLAESHYQKFVAQEIDPMTGKTVNNELHTLLNMGNSGLPVPEVYQPAVERAMAGFETYYKKGLSPGAKDTPLNRMKALQAYKRHTSLLSESK